LPGCKFAPFPLPLIMSNICGALTGVGAGAFVGMGAGMGAGEDAGVAGAGVLRFSLSMFC